MRNKIILVSILFIVIGSLGLLNSQLISDLHAQIASYPISYIKDNSLIKIDNQSKSKKNKGKFIIKLKDTISKKDKDDFLKKNNLKEEVKDGKATNRITTNKVDNLTDTSVVELIEEDATTEVQAVTVNDPSYKDQWYLKGIEYETMINSPKPKDAIVAVLDTGICEDHPDLQGKVLTGWNFVDNNSNTHDNVGHGCMVSGIIAANTNNSIGIAGGSLNTKILPIKVVGDDSLGSYSNLISGIDYAIEKKVDIINISLGGYFDSNILKNVINRAIKAGIKVVASAGNTGNEEIMYPAKYSDVISVGSVENDYTISSFSSSSQDIKLWAFGGNILTTIKDGKYITSSGTSLASALVTSFIASGGKYEIGRIINYLSKDGKPVFFSDLIHIKESISNLSFTYPSNLAASDFINPIANKATLINWEKNIHISRTEQLIISVWNRDNEKEINEILKYYKNSLNCYDNFCISNLKKDKGQYIVVNLFAINNASLVRITYNIDNLIGYNLVKEITKTMQVNNKNIEFTNELEKLKGKITLNKNIYPQVQTCGGITDPNTNDFPCCSSAGNTDYNDANCTWYAMYKRPDLRGEVTGNAGDWYQQAQDHDVPVSSDPTVGSIVVWSGHVAYIESVQATTMTWSEQNCLKYYYDSNGKKVYGVNGYNASVTRPFTSTYGGTLIGFIPLPSTTNNCSGNNPVMSFWNQVNSISCTPINSLTILPDSSLTPSGNNTIIIQPQ